MTKMKNILNDLTSISKNIQYPNEIYIYEIKYNINIQNLHK